MRILFISLSLAVLPWAATAHHSRAHYSEAVSELEGELVSVHWSNPHVGFTLSVVSENGPEELWRVEGVGNVFTLQRGGITRDLFEIGQRVRVAGSVSTRRVRDFLATNLLLPDGLEVVLDRTAEPYWSEQNVGRFDPTVAESKLADALSENRGIFRVWSGVADGVGQIRRFPFTEAAIAARAAWDPVDNFTTRCEQEGMPRIMTNPHPFEFVDEGTEIRLNSQLYDTVRLIHMDRSAPPENEPASHLGYSVGRWEGGSLVVTTTRINWPYFDNIGTSQSEDVKFIERFTVTEDQARLDYHLTVIDPMTFSAPATYERYWLALGETIRRYDCQVY